MFERNAGRGLDRAPGLLHVRAHRCVHRNLAVRRQAAEDEALWFHYEDPLRASTLYRVDPAGGELVRAFGSGLELDPQRYVVEQHFVPSSEGARVPVFVTRQRALTPDGQAPVHLYGYGGFDIAMTPRFRAFEAAWVERGGIAVTACLRGGGEYGTEWHEAGTRLQKQNTFDDFHAVAQWLVDEGWTRPERIAIAGGSNGGLLVGACLTQRPELYGAALPAVGVLDMLRFDEFTVGRAWIADYGDPDDPEEFAALRAYSPLHNVRPGTSYPPTLVLTGDHDDRVVPAHSYKFAAALQAAQGGEDPVLLRVETRAGHGGGTPKSVRVDQDLDRFSFCARALDWEPQP